MTCALRPWMGCSRVMPDRSFLTMDMPFMRAYTTLVVKTCHRRGCFAIGGMSAMIPIKGDAAENQVGSSSAAGRGSAAL